VLELLPIFLFAAICLCLMLGFPVAFTLGGTALLFAGFGITQGIFAPGFLLALPDRVFGIVQNSTLIAVPLFVLMGVLLEKTRIAETLLTNMAQLLGRTPGGLGISIVLVGALLAASTGIVGATVVTMGLISLPAMLKHRYDPALATGTICATGTLGQIIPPSIVLVLLGDILSNAYHQAQISMGVLSPKSISVSDLFVGAATCDEGEHFGFAFGEGVGVFRLTHFAHEAAGSFGAELDLALGGCPDGIAEGVGFGVLEEVADGTGADGADDGGVFEDGGEGDDLGLGALTADVADSGDPIHHRHQQVHEDDIRFEVMGEFEGFGAILGFADNIEVGVIEEEHLESLADDGMVVGDHDPDGHRSSAERDSDSGTRIRDYITAFGVNLPPPFGGDRVPSKFSCVNQPAVGRCARRLRLLLEG